MHAQSKNDLVKNQGHNLNFPKETELTTPLPSKLKGLTNMHQAN